MSQTATAERQTAATETLQESDAKGDVAVISPPRLQYHPLIEQRFGIDRAQWRALTDAVFPAARTTDAIVLALSYCKARKLDPFKRVVHIVPVWDRDRRCEVETVWPGIAEHRTTAFRTGQYAGCDAAAFGDTVKQKFTGTSRRGEDISATVEFPQWCQITVYRLIEGQRVAIPGPRVYWLETYAHSGRTDVPNDRWQRAPFQMIEKCAEAAALRRAFPEELGDEMTDEEAAALHRGPDNAKDVSPPAAPTRADFPEGKRPAAATGQTIDGDAEEANEPEMEYELVDESGAVEMTATSPDDWAKELIAAGAPGKDGAFTPKALAYLKNNAEAALALADEIADELWSRLKALLEAAAVAQAAATQNGDGAPAPAPAKVDAAKPIIFPVKAGNKPDPAKYVALINDEINKAVTPLAIDNILKREEGNLNGPGAKIARGIRLNAEQRKAGLIRGAG